MMSITSLYIQGRFLKYTHFSVDYVADMFHLCFIYVTLLKNILTSLKMKNPDLPPLNVVSK